MFQFQTKDSGRRAEFSTGMVRDTQEGKPRFDLIFPKGVPYDQQMITRFAALMARGAEKYTERNWEKARTDEELQRYYSSAMRHLTQWINGEDDEDHAAAVMFNVMAGEFVKYHQSEDEYTDSVHDPADLAPPPLDGDFYDACGAFNSLLRTNCLRKKHDSDEIHAGPYAHGPGTVTWRSMEA